MIDAQDTAFMARAIQLAWRGRYSTHPNPRVGCIIAKRGRILGEGWHERAGEGHAETRALSQAGPAARGDRVCDSGTVQPLWSHTAVCQGAD